jgi:cytochrome bd-type quinol oxidase subunit 1
VIQLALANLLFTPLIGLAAWYGLRQERPSAARQALHVTLPIGLATTIAWVALLFSTT